MEKNHIIGFILIFATLLLFNMLNPPSKEELEASKKLQDSIAAAEAPVNLPEEAVAVDTTVFVPGDTTADVTEEIVILENDVLKLSFSTKGGFIQSAELKNYKNSYHPERELTSDEMEPVLLLADPRNSFSIEATTARGEQIQTGKLNFVPVKNGNRLTMTATIPGGETIGFVYELGADYTLKYDLDLSGTGISQPLHLYWSNHLPKLERGDFYEQRFSSIYFKKSSEDDADYCSCASNDVEEMKNDKIDWISQSNQFFNTALIARTKPFAGGVQTTEMPELDAGPSLKRVQSELYIDPAGSPSYAMEFFIGPNDFEMLKTVQPGLEEIIPYGSSIFGSINRWVIRPFFNFLNQFLSTKGLVIILMIFIIKMLLYPLLYKMLYSQAKMGALKPELAHLKEKYKDDNQKQQMETMKIYQEYGVSPLSGCMPMLLQMPIWIALYRFFPANIDFRQEKFLWANDLSSYDAFFNLPFEIPFMGSHLSLFTILWAISTLIYTYYNSRHLDMAGNPAMKYMQYLMPIMFLGFFNTYASGLTAYMFFSNLINIIQIIITKNFIFDEDKIREELMVQKAKPKKKSSFQARLEEAMKQQQQIQAKKKKK